VKDFDAREIFATVLAGADVQIGEHLAFGTFPARLNPDGVDEYFALCVRCDESEYLPKSALPIALAAFLDRFSAAHEHRPSGGAGAS